MEQNKELKRLETENEALKQELMNPFSFDSTTFTFDDVVDIHAV